MIAERFESALWETTSLLLVAGREAVLVDPGISTDEVERLATRAAELGSRVTHVLATHADWDHVCGIAAFPEAEATMSQRTAELVASGEPAALIEQRAQQHGLRIKGQPRVDRVVAPGNARQVGPFLVETIALPGHTTDGVGYRIRDLDLLAIGDYLSAIEFPFASSTAAYRATLAWLIDLLHRDPPGRVVPGHGPELSTQEARSIAEADLAYLWSLHTAVAHAVDRKDARAAALSIPVPRAATDNQEAARTENVDATIAELIGN